MKCCICGKQITMEESNNPEGAAWKDKNGNIRFMEFDLTDRCCNNCNEIFVIPGRVYRAGLRNETK